MLEQQKSLVAKDAYIRDLEDYIDDLLVKVIESQPKLLQNPFDRKILTIGGQRSPPNTFPSRQNEGRSPKPLVSRSVTHNSLRLVTADAPPGVYVATTVYTERGEGETVPTLVSKPSRFSRTPHLAGTKDGVKPKRALILSPFKRLQALIK